MSGEIHGEAIDLSAIAGGDASGSGVPAAEALLALVEAAAKRDEKALDEARRDVIREVGVAGLLRACGVIGNFERMTRIADTTGIPIDATVQLLSEDFRHELGLERFASAGNSRPASALVRIASPLFRRAARHLFPRIGRAAAKKP